MLRALALAALLAPSTARAVEVARTTPPVVATDPGRVVTAGFRVTSAEATDAVERLTLPDGWSAVTPPSRLTLAPSEPSLRVIAFTVPPATPPGRYEVRFGADDGAAAGGDVVEVDVARVAKVEARVERVPDLVVAGETFTGTVDVANLGNAPARLRVEALTDDGFAAVADPPYVDVDAGGVRTVDVRVTTPAHASPGTRAVVRLSVTGDDAPRVGLSMIVPVLPMATSRLPERTLPTTAAVSTFERDGEVAAQAELHARGAVDRAGKVVADAFVRTPATAPTVTPLHDELRLDVAVGRVATFRLGDGDYVVSDLTTPSRYGRGAAAQVALGDAELAAQHVEGRFGSPFSWTAARAAWHAGDRITFGADAVDLEDGGRHDLVDAWASFAPAKGHLWTASWGLDASSGASFAAQGLRVGGTGAGPREVYAFQWVHAGPDFHGAWRDADVLRATGEARLSPVLVVHGAVDREITDLDLADPDVPSRRDGRVEIGARTGRSTGLSADGGVVTNRAIDPLDAWHRGVAELGAHAIVRASGQRWSIADDAFGGVRRTAADPDAAAIGWQRLTLTYRPGLRTSLSAYGTWASPSVPGSIVASGGDVGVDVGTSVGDRLPLSVSVARRPGAVRGDLRAGWRGPNLAIAAAVEADRSAAGAASEAAGGHERVRQQASLSVQVPFAVPLGADRSAGGVRGRVVDADAPGRPGVEGVVVTAGGRVAITDAQGRFLLAGLAPGDVSLQIDRSTVAMGEVTVDELPIGVPIVGGELADVDVALTRGAAVHGHVVHGTADAGGGVVLGDGGELASGGVPGVLVTLTDGVETLSRLTGADGAFAFDGVRPGAWRLVVDASRLGPHERIDGPERSLALEAGRTVDEEVAVRPVSRRIVFVDGGDLGVGGRAALPPDARIDVAATRVRLLVGDRYDLRATAAVSGSRIDAGGELSCDLGDRSPVSFERGALVAVRPGRAEVRCAWRGLAAPVVSVVVDERPPVGLYVRPATLTVGAGDDAKLTATAILVDGSRVDVSDVVTWTIDAPAVATVDGGRLHAAAIGRASVRAEWHDVAAFPASVVVTGDLPASLAVTGVPTTIETGDGADLGVTAALPSGPADVAATCPWRSSDPDVAVVDRGGRLRAVGAGHAELVASWRGVEAPAVALDVVIAPRVTSLELDPPTAVLDRDRSVAVRVTAHRADGSTRDVTSEVAWTTTDADVAAVGDALLTAIGGGHATVRAVYRDRSPASPGDVASAPLPVDVVDAHVAGLIVDPASLTVPVGSAVAARAVVVFEDGRSADVSDEVAWRSTDPAVVAGDGAALRGLSPGSAELVAVWRSEASPPVAVRVVPAPSRRIVLVGPSGSPAADVVVRVGERIRASALVRGPDGSDHDAAALVAWGSDAGAVRVEADGTVVAVHPGVAAISASLAGAGFAPAVVVVRP